jgi:hypothetical protein
LNTPFATFGSSSKRGIFQSKKQRARKNIVDWSLLKSGQPPAASYVDIWNCTSFVALQWHFEQVSAAASAAGHSEPLNPGFHRGCNDAGGIGAQTNAPKRKVDSLADIRDHCGLLNDPGRLKRLKEQYDLAQSLASIRRAQQQEKKSKKGSRCFGAFR